jgi:hypothetical protein
VRIEAAGALGRFELILNACSNNRRFRKSLEAVNKKA